jgi:KTSC domain-containing protein
MVEFKAVVSSNIQGIGYTPEDSKLHVEFKGGSRYTYSGVPEDVYEDFLNAPSKGIFFADTIKDSYPYVRG